MLKNSVPINTHMCSDFILYLCVYIVLGHVRIQLKKCMAYSLFVYFGTFFYF